MRRVIVDIVRAGCTALTGFIEKAGSRKFILLMIATHAMYTSLLPPEYWTMIALAWNTAQGGQDMVRSYRLPDLGKPTRPSPRLHNEFQENLDEDQFAGVAVQ